MTEEPPALRPVGATRTATALAARTGLPVRSRHIPALAEAGHLDVACEYKGGPLYDRDQTAKVPEWAVAALPGMPPNPPGSLIEAFAVDLGRRYDLDIRVAYRARSGRWHLDWEVRPDGNPDPAELRKDLAAHPAGAHRRLVDMATPAHRAIAAARRTREPGAAVVLDAATGEVLLDTLVNPDGAQVEPAAAAVHGITEAELARAPTWPQVWPRLAEIARSSVDELPRTSGARLVRSQGRESISIAPSSASRPGSPEATALSEVILGLFWLPVGLRDQGRQDSERDPASGPRSKQSGGPGLTIRQL